jgi:prepilin-type N-terminal cleavage/methylation domain-containing protein
MGPVDRSVSAGAGDERGFSLIELMVAMLVLTAGMLPLVAVFAASVQRMSAATPMLIAREKAREAIESVHAARDTGKASWITIQNEGDDDENGIFLDGEHAIMEPGPDGIVNTGDDDDENPIFPRELFSREIQINPLMIDGSATVENPNLRELVVIVRYRVNNAWFEYRVVTYISAYS